MNESYENVNYGVGVGLTKIIDGKRVNLSATKKSDEARLALVKEMSDRHDRYLTDRNWLSLYELAIEYAGLGATSTSAKIMLEIPSEFKEKLR